MDLAETKLYPGMYQRQAQVPVMDGYAAKKKGAAGCRGPHAPRTRNEAPMGFSVAMMLVLGAPVGGIDLVRLVMAMLVDVAFVGAVCLVLCVALMTVALAAVMLLRHAHPSSSSSP